ncbi:MAG: gliding motility-associated C-terminal domain-containing protein, partial [Candidatus Latescibacteria bacterium]|nr:gliding motility-associated C-terminal domain-containing protein [Candidatus Latescibacterota bacterium]
FDLLRFALPSAAADVAVRVGGQAVEPTAVTVTDTDLQIDLPAAVIADTTEVSFAARVVRNATVFELELGSSDRPGLWQSVESAGRRANMVMLPALIGTPELIGDLVISSPTFTPNGDGVNDQLEIHFVAFKVTGSAPGVDIFDLAGRHIKRLSPADIRGDAYTFAWNGRDAGGTLVPPGAFLYRIDLGAEAGEDTALRTVAVAY